MSAPVLPDPECSFGYPLGQIQELLGDETRYGDFLVWLRGRKIRTCHTATWCPSSQRVQCGTTVVHPSGHGPVVYAADLHRWMQEAAA